jgi:citrate lyase subunit beta/citryl-CoA lyase
LQLFGVQNARLLLEDAGALPFVVSARIECALCRAGFGSGRRETLDRVQLPEASARDRMRRSRLYLPGNNPKYFINAALYRPDAIIFDLEDSVSHQEKDSARILVRNALASLSFAAAEGQDSVSNCCERMVRINQLPIGLMDLDAIIPEQPDVVLIPKVETAAQLVEVDARITEIMAACGSNRALWLMPILESAAGIENVYDIARASERVCSLTIGLEDYTADIGAVKTEAGAESLYARTRMLNAAKAAGVQASDSVYSDIGDLEGLARWAEKSRALGFDGIGCVHPLQIEPVHRAFAPSEQEIEKALRIVTALQEAEKQGLGVVSLGSKMIDAPVVHRARKLLARAEQMGLVTAELRSRVGVVASTSTAANR